MLRILVSCLLIVTSIPVTGQEEKKRSRWLPDHVKLQFAGDLGLVSAAGGYTNKKRKLELDFYYGYLPKSVGGIHIHTFSSKGSWLPLKPLPKGKYYWKPLSTGVILSYTFGEQYFSVNPQNYPFNYYDYSTGLHFGIFAGTQVGRKFQNGRSLEMYYELVTFDSEMVSYFANVKSLDPTDILSIAIGLKYSFH